MNILGGVFFIDGLHWQIVETTHMPITLATRIKLQCQEIPELEHVINVNWEALRMMQLTCERKDINKQIIIYLKERLHELSNI